MAAAAVTPVRSRRVLARLSRAVRRRPVIEAVEPRVLFTSYTIGTVGSFNGTNGAHPYALVADGAGNLYGVTHGSNGSGDSNGSVFEIPAGTTTIIQLAEFQGTGGGSPNGLSPNGTLTFDAATHALYGATDSGGDNGDGSIFKVDLTQATPTVSTLVSFDHTAEGGGQGVQPQSGFYIDGSGILFGTTFAGGNFNEGTVFETQTTAPAAITTLAQFNGTGIGKKGSGPQFGVTFLSGNLYGIAQYNPDNSGGEVYKYNLTSQAISSFFPFSGSSGTNGNTPAGGLVSDGTHLFGTLFYGGANGYIFQLDAAGNYTQFGLPGGSTATEPQGSLAIGTDGNLYGVSSGGGANNNGAIYMVDAATHAISTVASFDHNVTGNNANGGLVFLNNKIFGTASDNALNNNGFGAVFSVTVAGPPAKLVFLQGPTSSVAASALGGPSITVEVEDAAGNVLGNDETSVITLSIASPVGLGFGAGSTTSVTTVDGVATFHNLILNRAGMYTFTAADAENGGFSVTSSSFTITHANAAKVVFITQPPNGTTTSALSPSVVVQIQDAFGNLVDNVSDNISLAVSSGPATTLTGNSVSAVQGVAAFPNLKVADVGTYRVTASDGNLSTGISNEFMISAPTGPAAKLVFVTQPVNGIAGSAIPTVKVFIEDADGNLVITNSSAVTLSVTSGPGTSTFSGTATVDAIGGVATFTGLTFNTAGTYSLGAADTGLAGATSGSFLISPAAGSGLAVINTPTFSAGNPTTITTGLTDAFGNLITTDSSSPVTIHIVNPDGSTTTLGPVTVTNGVATFSFNPTQAGAYSFNASSGTFSVTNTSSSSTTITYTTPTLVFAQPIGTITAGQKLANFNVTLYNTSGVVTAAKPKVALALLVAPTGGKIFGGVKVTGKNGTALFKGIYFKTAGTYQLTASAVGFGNGTSTTFVVVPAAAKKITFGQQPTPNPVAHGNSFSTSALVVDAFGNRVSGVAVTLGLSNKKATLAGVLSETTVGGVATFSNISVSAAGKTTITAATGKLKATSKSVTVS